MENAQEYRVVFITTETYENAVLISKILVSERIAACCSIAQNIKSVFGWQGVINERTEHLIIAKTSAAKLSMLESRVSELHTDEVPEIIALSLESGAAPYLNWMGLTLAD